MSSRGLFADMRRAGFGVGVSRAKLVKAMLEILRQLPVGTSRLKDTVAAHLGMLGQMTPTRDLNAAWNEAKRKAANFKKANELAEIDGSTVNQLVSKMIKLYQKANS